MKKTITSLFLLCASMPFMAQTLEFTMPQSWQYVSPMDEYAFTIESLDANYEGEVALYAQSVDTDETFLLQKKSYSVGYASSTEDVFSFNGQDGLVEGEYTMFFTYEDESGEMVEFDGATTSLTVITPSPLKIPITTTTGGKGQITISNGFRSQMIMVNANRKMDEVKLFDMSGREVKRVNAKSEKMVMINTSGMQTGKYIVYGRFGRKHDTKKVVVF